MDTPTPPPLIDTAALARAIRFAMVCVVLGFCYLNIRCALSIDSFIGIFKDMLNGAPLPPLTVFVIQFRVLLTSISVTVPFCAILILFNSQLIRSFYALGILALVTLVELVTLYCALVSPLKLIIQAMGASPAR